MPTKTKAAADPVTTAVKAAGALFHSVVEQALKQFHNPAWLGTNSPLASPYFLGPRLFQTAPTAEHLARGQALQELLRAATEQMIAQQPRRGAAWRDLLDESYFTATPRPVHQIIHKLHLAEATYHRHRNAAIQAVGEALLAIAKPALYLEPLPPPARLIGRDASVGAMVVALQRGASVGLSGPGGVGKTTLGRSVAHTVAQAATFWYTFVPGLNDRIPPLLFALAWFLHGHGASTLWSQLVADRGEIDETIAVNLLRHDCATITGRPLLLAFDEVDLLHPEENEAHAQLCALLATLRTVAPCLYIGQKVTLESDLPLALVGLTRAEMALLLAQAQITLSDAELDRLHDYTQGNPRLLELFLAFSQARQRTDDAADDAGAWRAANFTQEPSLEFLLRRIWQHLNESEMYLLERLAVFRNPVPRQAWNDQAQQAAIGQLVAWHLVQTDGQGMIQLLPALRDALYQQFLSSEEKELLHLEAANLRAQYGQFTAAAHHYAAGGESAVAVHLLHTYQAVVIEQGQAAAALTIVSQISQRHLDQEVQETLTLLRAQLQKLLGHYAAARQTLGSIRWRIPFLAAQRWRVEGDIAELRGEVTAAQAAYQAGLTTIDTLISEKALFHRDLGYLYTNDVAFAKAEQEVARIRHEAANLEGFLAEMRGDLPAAEAAYATALTLAQDIQYFYGIANSQNNLGRIYGWQRQLAAAEAVLQQALTFFQQTGRLNKLASATYNLALARRLAKAFPAALPPAHAALDWFTQLGEAYGRAVTLALLAEIHLGLDELAQAEHFARQVIAEEHTSCLPDGLRTLGEVYTRQGKFSEAEALLRQSLAMAQTNEDRILEAYALRAIGELHVARAEPVAAQVFAQQAATLFQALGMAAELA